jgi:serine/threonine protein kinase/WD40 repeat protein
MHLRGRAFGGFPETPATPIAPIGERPEDAAMPAEPRRDVKEIFGEALEIPDADARRAFLDRRCDDDAELRRRLDALLAAHDAPASALERPLAVAAETITVATPTARDAGAVLAGKYKLLEPIGEGGMGQVWVADQLAPLRRRVAVKVIKPGMDSRAVLARFEAERQALALMDHPNIARVLDAGTAEDGRPFFAMELVKGVPITEFCDARRLAPRERLALFVPVCAAVQHAHQKGIIHRDLKPSNVLVALHDDEPVPKVIDFGVAKAVGQQLTEKTVYTGFGALVGTPAYMAPEQATLNQLDVDTRTDVYALGVLLYELLAGSPPFEPERLKRAALDEVLRLVREEEPPRPSARLSTSGQRASLAAVRRSDPESLSRLIRGELDWIVMKALEKDRNRRYDTATSFAADVRRYLDGDAVQAHPPGAIYRSRKFARKHRAALTTAGLFAALLVSGTLVSTWQAVRATRFQRLAALQTVQAQLHALRADAARREAEKNAAGLRLELDLDTLRDDPRVGLLRLVRTLDALPADERALREFAALNVLASGQGLAPLLPPLAHDDGQAIQGPTFAPDRSTLLTRSEDGTVCLWDTRAARRIATLREGAERVDTFSYSPDGRTVCTLDEFRIGRFWDAPRGTLRARTEGPLPAGEIPGGGPTGGLLDWLANRRLLTAPVAQRKEKWRGGDETVLGPVVLAGPLTLWDTATGRRIAAIEATGRAGDWIGFVGEGRWIVAVEGGTTLRVLDAGDGRDVARLPHPGASGIATAFTDAAGRRFTTAAREGSDLRVRVFDPDRGWAETTSWAWRDDARGPVAAPLAWWGDETLAGRLVTDWVSIRTLLQVGQPRPIEINGAQSEPLAPRAELVLSAGGVLHETRGWRLLRPPPGRKYHPDLARFAPDGRFVASPASSDLTSGWGLIDMRTERFAPTSEEYHPLPGGGWIAPVARVFEQPSSPTAVRLLVLPPDGRLDLPPDLLALWAQVAACGELGPDGELVPWDEPTWQRWRQELAARPAPRADVPFPGHLAHDTLHWLRSAYRDAASDAERLRLAGELHRRAERLGDRAEALRWRDEVARLAPKPGAE